MIQAKQHTGFAFAINEPRITTIKKMLPKVVWEVPPPILKSRMNQWIILINLYSLKLYEMHFL